MLLTTIPKKLIMRQMIGPNSNCNAAMALKKLILHVNHRIKPLVKMLEQSTIKKKNMFFTVFPISSTFL